MTATSEYVRIHKRIYKARGKASGQQCVRCPKQAHDWARIHGQDGQDPWADYVPMCRSCHIRYDGINEAVRTANQNRRGVPLTPEHRAAIARSRAGHAVSPATRAKISAALAGNQNALGGPGRPR
jgi:hypothetical protein